MSSSITMLARVEAYLDECHKLGFKMDSPGNLLRGFARFADGHGHEGPLTSGIAVRWAKEEAIHSDPFTWAGRLARLRPFARHLAKTEPRTEFPAGMPFGQSTRRLAPHIYTVSEIDDIITCAQELRPGFGSRTAAFPILLGLLAGTGLRISEVLGLRCGDIDLARGQLKVRNSKFGRTRIVPLHPTALTTLQDFMRMRAGIAPASNSEPFFIDEESGGELGYMRVWRSWNRLTRKVSIVPRGGHPFIRLHDLRHTFICRRLMLWQADGTDIDNAVLALSVYVGHVSPKDTYWYLQAVPELMALAGERFEHHAYRLGENRHA
ncbi:tyrosine-type recombinase/integrase [Ciceribacter sp. RN22]|uniref:tyrosine-type recombinase/integrase n=1 Tax=Ciceribacter sp. RN22 TaxID=2954932 RepID=UPI002092048A|nr:tyrosine-type recombinase/integrase [Ciceribacter sp. RN22]MCO6180956.1 tyrosine-type recombinase/integrase [Ciceribacter sp. RN22]